MFFDYLKELFVKNLFKKDLNNSNSSSFTGRIETIGLVVDENDFAETDALLAELISSGFREENIEVIALNNKLKSGSKDVKFVFSGKHLNWNKTITDKTLREFIDKQFDLLISYYDTEKAIMLLVTGNSKAKFKVGFSSVDKRLNDLIIGTNLANYRVFVQELNKYLKILNKL